MVIVSKKNSKQKWAGAPPHILKVLALLLVVGALAGTFILMEQGEGSPSAGILVAASSATRILSNNKPFLVYGTAWKKEHTARFVYEAVKSGFRFIDTACQPKHYNEAGVGEGWKAAAAELHLDRSDLFLQTKFSPTPGQDINNMPFNPDLPIEDQVRQSIRVSLENLQTPYLDSLVLHSPYRTMEDTMRAWRTMESFVEDGTVLRLGISNCYDYQVFTTLYELAKVKPSVLQNRFYAEANFDTDLRKFVKDNNIWYQSFWTLTANRHALNLPEVHQIAEDKGLTPQTLMFAFLMTLGYITPLSGTTSPVHMAQDVAIMERMQGGEVFFESDDELRKFAQFLGMPEL